MLAFLFWLPISWCCYIIFYCCYITFSRNDGTKIDLPAPVCFVVSLTWHTDQSCDINWTKLYNTMAEDIPIGADIIDGFDGNCFTKLRQVLTLFFYKLIYLSFTILVTCNFFHFAWSYQIKVLIFFKFCHVRFQWAEHGRWFTGNDLFTGNGNWSELIQEGLLVFQDQLCIIVQINKDWSVFWLKSESGWKLLSLSLFHINLRTSDTIIGQYCNLGSLQPAQFDHFISYYSFIKNKFQT